MWFFTVPIRILYHAGWWDWMPQTIRRLDDWTASAAPLDETMIKVKLYTSDFGFVHEGWMPRFNESPKILVWGQRLFKYHENGKYLEVFSYALVPMPDPRQRTMDLAEVK